MVTQNRNQLGDTVTSSKLVFLNRSEIPEDNLEALEKIRTLEDHAKHGRQKE